MTTSATTSREAMTPQQRLTIVKHLANGKPFDVIATITSLPRDTIAEVARHHGHPDLKKLEWAADVIEKKIRDDETASLPSRVERTATPQPATTSGSAASITMTTAAQDAAAPLSKPDEIRVLLNNAKGHPSKQVQRQADRVFDAIDRLKALIREDAEKNSERRKAEAEKQRLRAEVAELEAKLAQAKARLRGKPAPAPAAPAAKTTAPRTGETYPCRNAGCDRDFDTPQGRSLHERMKCDHRDAA